MISLHKKILLTLLSVIIFFSVCVALLGFFVIDTYIVGRAQEQVNNDLKVAETIFSQQLTLLKTGLELVDADDFLQDAKEKLQLDYLFNVPRAQISSLVSDIAQEAVRQQQGLGGLRILEKQEWQKIPNLLASQTPIIVKDTPMARPLEQKTLDSFMSIEYARPFLDASGNVDSVLYGGKIINRNFSLVDEIAYAVFEDRFIDGKPIGTVTIFQDGIRIATNVLDSQGARAIGTRVSEKVYQKVIVKAEKWIDKAFVVTDWYITAYQPIRDIHDRIIGILYVGILQKTFVRLQYTIFAIFLGIILLTAALASGLFAFITKSITRPITSALKTSQKISEGHLQSKITETTSVKELNDLIVSFNNMSEKLLERETNLQVFNERVSVLNKRYLDLIGFVSHELKGILSSVILNTYLLQNQILGPINEKQEKTLKSMTRNLDYLAGTVKNFLNLSRIEKGELKLTRTEILLKEHIFDATLEAFDQQARERGIKVINRLEPDQKLLGDSGLLQIVANNLVGNAIKYGKAGGEIILSSWINKDFIGVEVYNDGKPIASIDLDKLFKKFSRIVYQGMEKVKGTGIGLFISKEIVEQHGGRIWVEPKENGNSFKFEILLKADSQGISKQ